VKRLLRQACLIAAQVALFIAFTPAAAATELSDAIDGVEKRYNSPKAMQLEFVQRYTWPGRPPRTESGSLYLRKPKRMRWEYRDPPGKLFLSDGKHVYFYSPVANRVEKMPLKESGDMRTPLAFLIGRVDLRRDFREFRTRPYGDNLEVIALPKSKKAPYYQVDFVLTADHRIKRLVVRGHDQSVMEFDFSGEVSNPSLQPGMFTFQMPAGAEFVEMSDDETGN
jgi:outer membrane lipoprotein carrier protein